MVITLRTMVRPWMVALLLMLTDRRSFATSRPAAAPAEAALAIAGDDRYTAAAAAATANTTTTEIASVGCNYKGRSYEQGALVNTDQPCLKCTCVIGNLICHLQVCPELPDPPPQGCVIVHKKNKCCAHLQCYYEQFGAVHSNLFSLQTESRSGPARMENSAIVTFDGLSKGCMVNGTIYAEGSAMDSSSLCEYCYCFKGHQQCVRPQCSLTIPGCTAVYKKHTCCPVRYKCSALLDTIIKNTTDAPTTEMSSLSARLKDCRINGRLISLGEPVIGVARSSCETCFCINGQVRCDKVICPPIRAQISPNCGPVYSEGHCCPTSYNCSSSSSGGSGSGNSSTGNNESHVSPTTTTTTTMTTKTTTTTTSTTTTAATITSPSTVTTDVVPLSSSSALPASSSAPSPSSPFDVSTMVETESTPTAVTEKMTKNVTDSMTAEDSMESRHANPVGLMHDDFGGFNVTEKSNNFEMDYDEPTLPPSLPNLKIIPFVAADAVVDEPAAMYDNYQPMVERVYNVSDIEEPPSPVMNSFSPPIETEGGFLPKDSPNGAHYVSEKFRTTTEHAVVRPIVHLDEPVEGLPPIGSVWCMSNGKKYKHGELLTDPSACNICICFNAKIVCQENCPAVKVGCQRVSDPNNSTCCGRIICNESENDVNAANLKLTEVTSESTATTSKIKDAVIEHIIYSASSTTNKPVVTSPSTTVKLSTSTEQTSSKPIITTTLKLIATSDPTTERLTISSTPGPIKRVEITTPVPKPEDEDYSFESMFTFLFNGDGDTPEQPPSSIPSSPNPSADHMEPETRIEHRTDDEIDEKIHFIDAKPQDGSATLAQQMFKTDLDSDVEQPSKPKDHPATKPLSDVKQHPEDKHDKIEAHDFNKTADVRPNTETKQRVDVKPHLEIKAHVEASPHASNKQQAEVKTHYGVKEDTQGTPPFSFKHRDDVKPHQDFGGKHKTEVKSHSDVKHQSEARPHSDSKLQPEVKIHTNLKHQTEVKSHFDVNNEQVGANPVKPYIDYKLPTEVKQHSDFKQHVDVSFRPDTKQHTEVKSNVGLKPMKTKFDADFNSAPSMLKISGCNIYGRMYRVGKIIAELSNPCLECMCTEIGVHCNQLKC